MSCASDLRWRLTVCGLALCLLSSGCDWTSQYTASQPSNEATAEVGQPRPLVCRNAIWDFGTIDNTKTPQLLHEFILENVCAELIIIDKVDPGCGCIVAKDFIPQIPANSTAGLPVTVNLAGPPRPFQKQVTIHLATSPPSRITLGIRGTIDASPAFFSLPGTVDFGTLAAGETASRVVKVTRFDASPVRFARGVPQSNVLSLDKAVKADDADSVIELTLSLNGSELRSGEFVSSCLVQTDHPTHPEFTIPVKARIAGESDGLVRSIFARKLRRGSFQELPLTNEAGSMDLETVSYEGAAPVIVELVQGDDKRASRKPTVRIVRQDDASHEGTSKVLSGHLLVTASGRDSAVRIPMFVQLTD